MIFRVYEETTVLRFRAIDLQELGLLEEKKVFEIQ